MRTNHARATLVAAVTATMAAGLTWAPAARAQGADPVAQADAAFKEAMQLRAAGREADACPRFAESKRLAPAIGVTLYLADCYEKTGRNASAWREFRDAEQMARSRGDKRAEVAAHRAVALEARMNRLTLVVPSGAAKAGEEIKLDGALLPTEFWNAPLAVDPGPHTVTVAADAQPIRTLNVNVEVGNLLTTVKVEESPPPAPAAPPPAAAAPSAAVAATPPEAPHVNGGGAAGQWGGIALVLAGGAGIGVGTWYLTSKTRQTQNGVVCEPQLRPGAVPIGVTSIVLGTGAAVAGVVVYYLNRPGRTEVSLGPSMLPGGAGAELRGTF